MYIYIIIINYKLIYMYIGFLNDHKELKLLIQQEKILNVKTKKGRKRRCVATILFVWGITFGPINYSFKPFEYNKITYKQVISNPELNSFDSSHNSGKTIRTGNGTILEFQQEIFEASSNDIDEVILVENNGILPGADGFPLNNNPRRRHPFGRPRMRGRGITVDPPQKIQGLGNIPEAPKVRSFKEVGTDLNARHGNRGDQCPAPEFDMKKEYTILMEDMSQKGIELECDQQRFNDLCVNQETGAIDEKSIFEAKGALQGEGQQMYRNLRRPANPDVRLDFEATDIKTGNTIFVDHKGMIDFQSLEDQGKDISRFPSHETVAYRMGQAIPSQKERFIGIPQGPKSANEVLHLVNFDKIRNSLEKPSLLSAVLNGAEDAGCGDNIAFINFE